MVEDIKYHIKKVGDIATLARRLTEDPELVEFIEWEKVASKLWEVADFLDKKVVLKEVADGP